MHLCWDCRCRIDPPARSPSARQEGRAHQELVDRAGALPSLADRPDDQRLAAPHIARGEQFRHRGPVIERIGRDVAARVERDAGLLESAAVALDGRGNVKADTEGYATSVPRVFAAGDMRRGQSLVVWAIREGRQCARAVDEFLMGASSLPR